MSDRRLINIFVVPAAVLAAFLVVGALANDYWRYVLSLAATAIIIGMGLTVLISFARCISLATGAFQALGAYTAALLMIHLVCPFPIAVLVAGIVGAVAGIVLAVPAVRFRGHNLALVTLVFQSIVIIAIRESKGLSGGAEGLNVPVPTIFGHAITSDMANLVVAAVFCALAMMPLLILLYGPFGKNLRALAINEVGARAFGIRPEHYLIAAFAVSSAAVAMAAAVSAPRFRIIDPESFGLHTSILNLAYPIVGGLGSVWGGALGGSLLRILPEVLRPIAGFIELILSAIVLVIIVYFRGGLTDLFARFSRRQASGVRVIGPEPAVGRAATIAAPARTSSWTATTDRALITTGVVKRYDALTAVDHVDLDVAVGSLHGVMGPNGAGKTTLFNMVSGFVRPDEGAVHLFGEDVTRGRVEDRASLGVTRTFQNVAIFPTLTCRENVIVGLGRNQVGASLRRSFDWALAGAASRREDEQARWALGAVGLGGLIDAPAGKLSLGDQRRLEIARAIVSRPRLILLDEPVSGVSHHEVEQIVQLLKSLNAELGATMLVVEHNIGFLASLCDRLSVMANGRLIAEGDPADVIARKDVRRIYFGEVEEAA
ncbi:ABC transporter permease subunit [Rhodopseudomonas palustris]|nr:branched-chain amino acid ABC transporter ATP-binding protein/permease [Rhodopseudomonas palustris]